MYFNFIILSRVKGRLDPFDKSIDLSGFGDYGHLCFGGRGGLNWGAGAKGALP
jgi:hypothetical protein